MKILKFPLQRRLKAIILIIYFSINFSHVIFAQVNPKPNIIFIMSDDHAKAAVSCYGNKLVQTPNIVGQIINETQLLRNHWLSLQEYKNRDNLQFLIPTDAPEGIIHPVAEFEPMQGVLIAYPFGIPMDLIVEMSYDIKITTIVKSESVKSTVFGLYEAGGVKIDNVDFLIADHDTYWTRDYGPWFIREQDKISIVNFIYNRPRPNDNIMPLNVADKLEIPFYNMPVVHTGGNFMSDGFSTAAQTELVYEENSISDEEVNQYMKDYLGIDQNIVAEDPLGEYIKHIDCWGKFLDVDKIMIAQVSELDLRYNDFEKIANYFATKNCTYGYPYQVIRIYSPGNYPYTPYTNSLILNNKVFVPVTGSQWDEDAIAVYQDAMPGYKIIPVDQGNFQWYNTDALHCRTHEIADIGMLKITHIPKYHHAVGREESYLIDAKIHPYSDSILIVDSLFVIYKINDGKYDSLLMSNIGEELFAADIYALPGDTVSYYIHAADASGRSENLPYAGPYDPFVFNVSKDIENLTFYPDTLFLNTDNDLKITVVNEGTSDANITDIYSSEQETLNWWIYHTYPTISEYPYNLGVGDSIVIYLLSSDSADSFADSLIVATDNDLYFAGIVRGEVGDYEPETSNDIIKIYPNPMLQIGNLTLNLDKTSQVKIEILSLNNQLIKCIIEEKLNSGCYIFEWDGTGDFGSHIYSGIYLVRVQIDGRMFIEKWVKI